MGVVWLAEDTVLQRRVALKILALENSSPELAPRLLREAVVLARLEHPGIVPVHDAGTLADGRTFYSMKYVEGKTLDKHITGLSLRECLQLLQRIAEPLAFAHARGIVHRDLKPNNIMIGAFGEVLIMDWGLARVTSDGSHEPDVPALAATGTDALLSGPEPTEHGTVLGTPGYMAPEQARGEVALIDARADVFALGAILNFLLRETAHTIHERPSRKPLVAIRDKAMAPEISARYASVPELASDIGHYLEGAPVSVYRETLVERTARLFSRHQVAVVLIAAYLLMRLLFILFARH
jgi:serine/threonine protein kinase